eukprot:scaffold40436_cov35-Tisochrysis_lutea.AAC.1
MASASICRSSRLVTIPPYTPNSISMIAARVKDIVCQKDASLMPSSPMPLAAVPRVTNSKVVYTSTTKSAAINAGQRTPRRPKP